MRRPLPLLILILLLLLLLLLLIEACDKSKSAPDTAPPPSAATSAAPVTKAAESIATPTTSPPGLAMTIDRSGAAACVPKDAVAEGSVFSAWVTGATKDAISFCLGSSREEQSGCFAVDLTTSKYTALPKAAIPIKKIKTSAFGTHSLEALEKEIKVCTVVGGSAAACKSIEVGKGYRKDGDDSFPADVSPDGKKLTVVRFHEGVTVNVDIYDLETKARISRTPADGRGNVVGDVAWIGKRIFISSCVDAGPGCSPLLWDPESKKMSSAAANVYGVDRPAHKIDETTWAFVDSSGGFLALIDIDTGFRKGEIKLPLTSDAQNSVSVAPLGEGKIAIVAGAPQGGSIEIVDLKSGPKLTKKITAPVCPTK